MVWFFSLNMKSLRQIGPERFKRIFQVGKPYVLDCMMSRRKIIAIAITLFAENE